MASINPIQIQKFLKGVDYPATKDDLVAKAQANDAPDDVVQELQGMGGQDSFDGPNAVVKALANS